MRSVAITLFLLLALAGVAFVPTGAAAPPAPPCNGTIATTQTVGPVTVFASPPCYTVSIEAMSCPIAGSWKDVAHVQQIAVRAYTCDDPAAAAAAEPCVCPPPTCTAFDTVGPIAQVVRVTGSTCGVTVYVLPVIGCSVEPFDGAKAVKVGLVTIVLPCGQVDYCEPPFECYPASAEPPALALCGYRDMCNDAGCPYPVGAENGLTVGPVHSDCGPQDLCSGPFRCTSPIGPMSAAYIPPVCIRKEATVGPVHADAGQCDPQQVDADLCYGDNAPQTVDAGAVVVSAELCAVQAASIDTFPVCIEREVDANVVKAGFDQCRQDHETVCTASPQRIHHYEEVAGGLVYAQVDFCLPHMPPPSLSTSSTPGPCGVGPQRCPAPVPLCYGVSQRVDEVQAAVSGVPVGLDVTSGCHVDLFLPALPGCTGDGGVYEPVASAGPLTVWAWSCDQETTSSSSVASPIEVRPQVSTDPAHVDLFLKADFMDCLWGEGYNPTQVGPLVTLWVWGCRAPYTETASSAQLPPCTCPPPAPLCYQVNRAVAWGPIIQVDDYCNVTIFVEAYCGLQGTPEDHPVDKVPKVYANVQTCKGEPPK